MALDLSLIFSISLILPIIYFLLRKYIPYKAVDIILKVSSVFLYCLFLFRCFLNDEFVWVINGGLYEHVWYKRNDYLQSFLRWFYMISLICIPCAVFFKNRYMRNFVVYFCLPMNILIAAFYGDFMKYFLTDCNRGFYLAGWIRRVEYSLEMIFSLFIPIMIRVGYNHRFDYKNKMDWIMYFSFIPLTMLSIIPAYLPQSLIGFTDIHMGTGSLPHILWFVVSFSLLFFLYYFFRFKSYETRFLLCTYLSLFLCAHYNSIYMMDLKLSRLPFQLCNLGSHLIILSLIINKQRFYNFTILANCPGALIAFLMPDVKEAVLSLWNIHFYIEHTYVLILPMLFVCLRISKLPRLKDFKDYFIGFTVYFLVCAITGVLFNAYLYKENSFFWNYCNYFYLFKDQVLNALPFLKFTHKYPVKLNGFTFYPLYMLSIYILYSLWSVGYYLVAKSVYMTGKDHYHLRKVRIELYDELGVYKKLKRDVPQKEYVVDEKEAKQDA